MEFTPEQGSQPLEARLSSKFRYEALARELEQAPPAQVLELAKTLAYEVLVVGPAKDRFWLNEIAGTRRSYAGTQVNKEIAPHLEGTGLSGGPD